MTSQQQQEQQQRIEAIIAQYPDGARLQDIVDGLSNDASGNATPRRTLQSWLKRWVNDGYLRTTGSRRGVRYFLANASTDPLDLGLSGEENSVEFPFSEVTNDLLQALRKPLIQRKPVAYHFDFLNSYRPNVSAYLSEAERDHLANLGGAIPEQPAGTFAQQY